MTEGPGVTAASVPSGGTGAVPDPGAAPEPRTAPDPGTGPESGTAPEPGTGPDPGTGPEPGADEAVNPSPPAAAEPAADQVEPHVRVDGRKLESALLTLRHAIVEVPLSLAAPGVEDARAERRKLLSQIDDYLLPRLRQSGAPVLVALVGSTGAGKSTLMNSLVGAQVSNTGTRRPTTNSPVLACNPGDIRWFAENVFLPTLPRVRQQGLAMPGRDGLLVLAESEGMPQGVALLDTPDIDSVVQAHREFAHQFLDASDLWLFMTSASRYADAAVWELLQEAKDRAASLAIVLSRVAPASARQLSSHFDAMLAANGLSGVQRFMIAETTLADGMLPPEVYGPVRKWLDETSAQQERRVAVLTQTMSGVLDTFRTRVPDLAAHVEAQLALHADLVAHVESCYAAGIAAFDEATKNGSLLRGEILARWQDFTGTGDLLRMLQVRRTGKPANRQRKRQMPARARALKSAVRQGLETLVASLADRAAEDTVGKWQQQEAGAALVREFAAGKAASPPDVPFDLAAMDFIPPPPPPAGTGESGSAAAAALARSSPDLATRSARAVSAWQDHVMQLVRAESVTKRSVARVVSFDEESLALVLTIGMLGSGVTGAAGVGGAGGSGGASGPSGTEGAVAVPQRLLTTLFGAGPLRDLGARARKDLHERINLLFDEEMQRFGEIIDAAGAPDSRAAAGLREAEEMLEAAR
jgi:energy-coupling factor transporter ATP-binding protein EcfA2